MSRVFAVWLTGIPSSGKSTLARGLRDRLRERGLKVAIIESDALRRLLTPNPSYTEEERDFFYRAMAVIGKYLVDHGVCVIFDATAHRRKYRDYARSIIKNFVEVHVYAPLDVCIERDVKGLYSRALSGEIKTLPGLQVEYEEPISPEVKVDTSRLSVDESLDMIIDFLLEKGYLE